MERMVLISEGAEAKIYAATLLGIDAVVKRRLPKRYRVKALDYALRKQRTKTEARAMAAAANAGVRLPSLLLADEFDIYMSRIKGTRLSDALRNGIDKAKLGRAAWDAGLYAGLMHSAGIAHGDYTPANIMLGAGITYVIDFGLSATNSSVEEMALDLLLMKRSIGCREFSRFMGGYRRAYGGSGKTIRRLGSIERRGRYQTRTMAAATG